MKTATNTSSEKNADLRRRQAMGRVGLLALLGLSAALVAGGYWYGQRARPQAVEVPVAEESPQGVLSEATLRILNGLEGPVELRWYAPVDQSEQPEEFRRLAARVGALLNEYERVSAGKVRVDARDPQTNPTIKAEAKAANITPFVSAGELVYFGLVVANGARCETIAPLTAEWEAALEPDISRAIERVTARGAAGTVTATAGGSSVQIDSAASEVLLRQFPDLASRSFDEMAQVLRLAALENFKMVSTEMAEKVADAQKALADAQANNGAAAQRAALQKLQQIQAEQADKLKEITAQLQEQIAVLERLTTAPRLSTPGQ